MIDTEDLTSYYPGYDDYLENQEELLEDDRDFSEDFILKERDSIMKRKIIDLKITSISLNEVNKLENYVWKHDLLIPVEMLYGELNERN